MLSHAGGNADQIDGKLRDEIARRVEADQARALGWLRELVATGSEAPAEENAQRLLDQIATGAGLRVQMIDADPDGTLAADDQFIPTGLGYQGRPNCLIRMPGAASPPLVANAHIDTVAIGDGWTRDPYGELDGSRLYGRGACDTKASVVAALLASAVLLDIGETPVAPIEIHSVIEEEPGGNGTLTMLRALGPHTPPRAVLVMEPTRLDLLTGHRGMSWYQVRCLGRAAHGSMPIGVNAIERAADLVAALRALNARFSGWDPGRYGPPRVNVGIIKGGHEVYTTPASCLVDFSVRFAPGQDAAVGEEVRVAIGQALPADAVELSFRRDFDAAETPEADPAVQAALRALRTVHPAARIGALAGTCDMRHYRRLLSVPTVVFGPGDLATAHGPDEYVDFPEVLVAARVIAEMALTPALARDATEARS